MKQIRTVDTPMFDNRFKLLYYGETEIGQIITTDKNYVYIILGKEFVHPKYKVKELQRAILRNYLLLVNRLALESKIMQQKPCKVPTMITQPLRVIKESEKIIK